MCGMFEDDDVGVWMMCVCGDGCVGEMWVWDDVMGGVW